MTDTEYTIAKLIMILLPLLLAIIVAYALLADNNDRNGELG